MERKEASSQICWQVAMLGGGRVPKDRIPIDAMRFHSVIKLLPEKGMMHGQKIGTELRYEHHSIRGLYLYIDHGAKTIRATAYGVSALSQVVDDFNLPLYRRDGGGA